MLAVCLPTALSLRNSRCPIAALERPSAISSSTSLSRGVSRSTARLPAGVAGPPASSLAITSGSIAVPPAATRRTASTNWSALKTRSLSR